MMMLNHWEILLLACVSEAALGYPSWIYARIRHPVVWMGASIAVLERNFNRLTLASRTRRTLGALAMALLLASVLAASEFVLRAGGVAAQTLGIAMLLAQRSLYDHVYDVHQALARKDLAQARERAGRIVGRDVGQLDEAGVRRAAIESLAESMSDGVIGPLFWAACFGLPGIACYKAINTADSMIGHKDERYLAYGWAAARLDDLANLAPARLSALLIFLCAGRSGVAAWETVRRDARKHASPNAGWPQSAMAGAIGLCLGGPQRYGGVEHPGVFLGGGTRHATMIHMQQALRLYLLVCGLVWLMLAILCAPRFWV